MKIILELVLNLSIPGGQSLLKSFTMKVLPEKFVPLSLKEHVKLKGIYNKRPVFNEWATQK